MDAQRGPLGYQGPLYAGVDSLIVHGVPGFMQRGEEGWIEEMGVHAGGNAHIAETEIRGKGMGGSVLAATLEVIAEFFDHGQAKIPLLLLVEGLMDRRVVHLLALADGANQFDLPWTQRFEHLPNLRRLHPNLVLVQQRIINMFVRLEEIAVLPVERHNLLEVRLKVGEVGFGARLPPCLVGKRRRA